MDVRLSTAYHPETDGASEQTNKTLIQMIRYHVERNQKGWSKVLPKIYFQLMNTVNTLMGISGFEMKMGRLPRVIPPIVPSQLCEPITAHNLTNHLPIPTPLLVYLSRCQLDLFGFCGTTKTLPVPP
jgi:hypothetical protein